MPRRRNTTPILTAHQRRRQIIDLLAGHLARMPEGLDIPPSQPRSGHNAPPQNLSRHSQNDLELSAN